MVCQSTLVNKHTIANAVNVTSGPSAVNGVEYGMRDMDHIINGIKWVWILTRKRDVIITYEKQCNFQGVLTCFVMQCEERHDY
jgi:hypothetical protein